jgi:hypothetical protein
MEMHSIATTWTKSDNQNSRDYYKSKTIYIYIHMGEKKITENRTLEWLDGGKPNYSAVG